MNVSLAVIVGETESSDWIARMWHSTAPSAIKAVRHQFRDCAVAPDAESVGKCEKVAACQGQSIENARL
jgi:hypothetical protein